MMMHNLSTREILNNKNINNQQAVFNVFSCKSSDFMVKNVVGFLNN